MDKGDGTCLDKGDGMCFAVSISEGLTAIWSEGTPHVEYCKVGHPKADGA